MEAPDNSVLTRALAALLDAPTYDSESLLRPFLEALVHSRLITPEGDDFLTVRGEGGSDYLALFTDLIELHFFEPGCAWETISAEDAIRSVIEGEFDGISLNPGGRTFDLSRDDIADFFEFDEEPS